MSNIFRHVYLRRQKFSFQIYTERKIGAENQRQSRFLAPVSGVCVIGLTNEAKSTACVDVAVRSSEQHDDDD